MFHGTDPNAWEQIRRLEMSIVCFLLLLLPSLSKQDGQQTGKLFPLLSKLGFISNCTLFAAFP